MNRTLRNGRSFQRGPVSLPVVHKVLWSDMFQVMTTIQQLIAQIQCERSGFLVVVHLALSVPWNWLDAHNLHSRGREQSCEYLATVETPSPLFFGAWDTDFVSVPTLQKINAIFYFEHISLSSASLRFCGTLEKSILGDAVSWEHAAACPSPIHWFGAEDSSACLHLWIVLNFVFMITNRWRAMIRRNDLPLFGPCIKPPLQLDNDLT